MGHTRTSPPRARRKIVVSEPAVSAESPESRFPASTTDPGTSRDDGYESRLGSLGQCGYGRRFDVLPGLGHGVHAHQQALALAVAAVTDGVDQVYDDPGDRRRLLKLVDSHRAYLSSRQPQAVCAATRPWCGEGRSPAGADCRGIGSLESGAWLEMISSAGPSASEIIFTECRAAAGPLRDRGIIRRLRQAKAALSVAASSEDRTIWQPKRGKDFTSRKRGLSLQRYHRGSVREK